MGGWVALDGWWMDASRWPPLFLFPSLHSSPGRRARASRSGPQSFFFPFIHVMVPTCCKHCRLGGCKERGCYEVSMYPMYVPT